MKDVRIFVKIDVTTKEQFERKVKEDGLTSSKVIRDFIGDYISHDERIDRYVINKDRKVVSTFMKLNNLCSSIEDKKMRREILYLLGELECLY